MGNAFQETGKKRENIRKRYRSKKSIVSRYFKDIFWVGLQNVGAEKLP